MARANGQGTLIKRGKVYMAKWIVNGKIYTRTTKCQNKKDAEKKLAEFVKPFQEKSDVEILENLEAKIRVADKKSKSEKSESIIHIKLKDLVDTYKADLSTSKITQSTINSYETMVSKLIQTIDKEYAYEVSHDDALQYLEQRKKEITPYTWNIHLSVLEMLFDRAMRKDPKIRSNPFSNIKRLKIDKSEKRRELTDNEVKRLCEEADKIKEHNGEIGVLFTIAVYTGLRKSDCCLLQWKDIDLKNKLINVLPIKTKRTGKKAILPIHNKLYERLIKIEKQDSEYVLPNVAKLFKKNAVRNEIEQVFKNAGIEISRKDEDGKIKIVTGFHAFRHYFISNCIRQGISVNVVQQMVAHNTASMSLSYSHVHTTDLRLPDYDDDTVKVVLQKKTLEAINKAKGIMDIDTFIMNLIEQKPITIAHEKTKQDIELEKLIDEIM